MVISNAPDSKFIFIHIYKNAGSSITRALYPFASNKWQIRMSPILTRVPSSWSAVRYNSHVGASELVADMGEANFKSYFSFAIVRNPWDWQVSLFSYMRRHFWHHQKKLVHGFGSFEEYIEWRCKHEVRLQKEFIYASDNKCLVSYVGRYENLKQDFDDICDMMNIEARLPHLNASAREPYKHFYTTRTQRLVREAFAPDIELFGYEFD